jgi:HSP20 family protein
MALMKWTPLIPDLAGTRERLNHLFGGLWETEGITTTGEWAPLVDIVENDRAITMKAELPGIDPKDVAVTIDNNVLTLKGERHLEKEVKKENYHRLERTYGTFARSFALPTIVVTENVKADFKNGVLTIDLPKKENAKPRTLEVKVA